MLEIKNLNVKFNEFAAVKDVSFSLNEGKWLMICGPNGAGKSTLLNALCQTLSYDGTVFLDGKNVKEMKTTERAKKIGILSQNHFVGYDFTVEEVVRLGRYAYRKNIFGGSREEDTEAVEKALAVTGLSELRKKALTTLSGGERQRTFLAQVFAQDPRVLLLDEPTNHLDLAYVKQIFEMISDWLKVPGRMVISVVHDLSIAKAFGTDAILMKGGAKVAEGPASEILSGETLNRVYETDVENWMREMLSQW